MNLKHFGLKKEMICLKTFKKKAKKKILIGHKFIINLKLIKPTRMPSFNQK